MGCAAPTATTRGAACGRSATARTTGHWRTSPTKWISAVPKGISSPPCARSQLTSDGTTSYTYDNNGNLASSTWDRANRLLSGGGSTFAYDGLGNRLRQTVGSLVTNYLNDLQPGLAVVLRATQGANTDQYVYSPRGIHEQQINGQWYWAIQDGLGSVRGMSNSTNSMINSGSYSAYGVPYGTLSGVGQMHGFTGEATNANGDLFLRARHYRPSSGVFASQDPLETMNRYAYVEGNPINRSDPAGLLPCDQFAENSMERFACLGRIYADVALFARGGSTVGLLTGDRGFTLAGALANYYLNGGGRDAWVNPHAFPSEMHALISSQVSAEVVEAVGNLACETNCTSQDTELSRLIPINLSGVRASEFSLDRSSAVRQGIMNAAPTLLGENVAAHLAFYPGYYVAVGGFTIRTNQDAEMRVGWRTGNSASVEVRIPVEIFDRYDWCVDDGGRCFASGEHPFLRRAGDFKALEQAGWAREFSWYSGFILSLRYTAYCRGGGSAVMNNEASTWQTLNWVHDIEGTFGSPVIPLGSPLTVTYQPQTPPAGEDWRYAPSYDFIDDCIAGNC